AHAEADSAAGIPDLFHGQVQLPEVLVRRVALEAAVRRQLEIAVLVVPRRGVGPGALAGEGDAPRPVPDARDHHPVLRHLAREPAVVLDPLGVEAARPAVQRAVLLRIGPGIGQGHAPGRGAGVGLLGLQVYRTGAGLQ